MSNVRSPEKPEFGQPNRVLGIARVDHFLVSYSDGDGRKQLALVATFGKNVNDGKPNVIVIAEQPEIIEKRETKDYIRKRVIEFLAQDEAVSADQIPDSLLGSNVVSTKK